MPQASSRELHEELGGILEDVCLSAVDVGPFGSRRRPPAGHPVSAGFAEENITILPGASTTPWSGRHEGAEENNNLAGGVLVTGSITVVGETRTLLGK